MLDFYVIINSYNREKQLNRLLVQLKNELTNYKHEICVWLDGCDYQERIEGVKYISVPHHGRERYYILFSANIKTLPAAKFYIKIDDDMVLADSFIKKALTAWHTIKNPSKIILNLLKDQRVTMWGSDPPVNASKYALMTDWVDGNFLADGSRFYDLASSFVFHPPTVSTSSGVFSQLTKQIRGKFTMWQVKNTLLYHGNHKSMMNPNRKEKLTDI